MKLRAIDNVTPPHMVYGRGRYQVLPCVLKAQQPNELFKSCHRGIANTIACQPSLRLLLIFHHAARRRACTSSADKAAGVTPGTLPAAARL